MVKIDQRPHPQPDQSHRDIDAAIGGIDAPGGGGELGQQLREGGEGDRCGNQQPAPCLAQIQTSQQPTISAQAVTAKRPSTAGRFMGAPAEERGPLLNFAREADPVLSQICPKTVPEDLARLEGFEPPTNGFGSHYSIRLSYRRVSKGLFLQTGPKVSSGPVTLYPAPWTDE